MSNAEGTLGADPVRASADDRRSEALTGTSLDFVAVGAVIVSLFFERLDRSLYLNGTSVIPDPTFDAAVLLLSLRYLQELVRAHVRLGRPTRREYVVAVLVVLTFVLGVVSLASLPSSMSSDSQVLKSTVHLGFLSYAAFLIGRAVSKELFEFALKLYFGLASAAGALAVVQALDLNAGHGAVTQHLHLIYRLHTNGYKAPCSFFSEPAELGYVMVAALVVALLRWRSIGRNRTIAGATLCALALFLSFPAGPAIVAVVLGLIVVVERRPKLSGRTWASVAALLVLLATIALASPVGSALYGRANGIVNGSDPSAQYRAAVDRASIRIWKIAPATGIGIGDTRRLLPFVYQSTTLAFNSTGFNDSNAYLSLLGETGVLGVVAALAVLVALIWPSTRPARFATVTQLNTVGVAVSYFVAGSFLLPTLWFWGGLRLAVIRSSGQPDLFDGALARLRGPTRMSSRQSHLVRALFVALVMAAVAALSYGFDVQDSNDSLRPVSKNGIAVLTSAPRPGDTGLARSDKALWSRRFCGHRCKASLSYIGGRIWVIHATWPTGSRCLVLDLTSFGTTKPESSGVTNGFTGLSTCPLGAG